MADAGGHVTIFHAGEGFGVFTGLRTFIDCTVVKRENRWWMFAGGMSLVGDPPSRDINLLSASLPPDAPLSPSGWQITADPDDPSQPAPLVGKSRSHAWDGKGGRHCPSYVRGFDHERNVWVERIYYAGAARDFMGPYAIGYVEWDGTQWVDQPAPCFTANEYWEHGSVYEPNVIYHDGMWKLWFVAGANQDDYLVQGYAESPNGRNDWSEHQMFFDAEAKVFDFAVTEVAGGFEAVFARVNVSQADLPETGLWWCHAAAPSSALSDWSEPIRITGPGPWKPVLRYGEDDPDLMFVFYDDTVPNETGVGTPFHFTLSCLKIARPG
jgi:hypothetical protein